MAGNSLRFGIISAALALSVATPLARAHEDHGHPAKIHEGSCEQLGAVAFALNGVGGTVDLDGNPVPEAEAVNPDASYQVMRSVTTIDATIDGLLAVPHALMVYASDEDLSAISCGNLGGARFGDELAVGLAEAGVPGHTGLALLTESADAPGKTDVAVYIGHALSPISAGGAHDDGGSHDSSGDGHAEDGKGHEDHQSEATPAA